MFGDAVLARLDRIWPNEALQAQPGGSPQPAASGSILAKTVSVISGGREGSHRPWVVLVSRRPAEPASAEPEPAITVETGHGAVSHATWISLAAACCSGLLLYSIKHRTTLMDARIGQTFRAIKAAQDSTAILKVEWAVLNEPARLQSMAAQYSSLKPIVPSQFVTLGDLARKLPAPGAIIPNPVPPPVLVITPPAPAPASAPELVASVAAPAPMPETPMQAAPPEAAPGPAPVAALAPSPAASAAAASVPDATQAAAPDPSPAPIATASADPPAPAAAVAPDPPPAQMAASEPPAQAAIAPAAEPAPPAAAGPSAPSVAADDAPAVPRAPAPAPLVSARPAMFARMHRPASIAPPKLPSHMTFADIAPPRIRLPAPAALHARPDVSRGHAVAPPLLHLAMARPPARHDVTLAEFMAQIGAPKPAARRTVPPHHIGMARSEPAHNLSPPSSRPEIIVARSEPAHAAERPVVIVNGGSGAETADHEVSVQPREAAAEPQPRYQVPEYRYPPYQMPYGSPYSPVYRSPWGPYAWSSRPYYPQQAQVGYAYQ